MNLRYQWDENVKPLLCFFLAGFLIASGFGVADWLIPKKPVEYRICIKDTEGDYICEVYK